MKPTILKVSIGIPIFKVESFIERCARSLFDQTYVNIEFVFVDDCSPDQSVTILERIASEYQTRDVKIIHHETNRGVSAARNTALANMTGDFILWVDADDWIEPTLVEQAVVKQKNTNADIVLFNSVSHYPNGDIKYKYQPTHIDSIKDYTINLIKKTAPYELWGRLIRRSLYLENQIKCLEGINIGEDFQTTTRLAFFSTRISSIRDFLYHYNCCNASALTKNGSVEQSWRTVDFVYSFFSVIDDDYKEAVEWMRLWSISCDYVSYGKYNAEECYFAARQRLNNIDHSSWILLPFSRRFILYFSDAPFLVKFFGKCVRRVNYILHK